ncbi:uncharacterized protein LOC128964370 [Oppia nitens]|uniref:uncharacterized protein LOC128964370 n=1 Tax=Oppia nitens TaxID=1686743 RepID=UPI0023DC73B4|nr:uncharacterized protein LOC128964370 [Oppia nitens]
MKWWAIQLFDSWGHFPVGFMDGTYGSLGDFDECIAVDTGDSSNRQFVGQYCTPKFRLDLDFSVQYGNDTFQNRSLWTFGQMVEPVLQNAFCIPSVCTPNDLKQILKQFTNQLHIDVEVSDIDCYHRLEKQPKVSTSQKIMICYLAFILVMHILALLIDYLYSNDPDQMGKFHLFLNGLLTFQINTYKFKILNEIGRDFGSQIMMNTAVFTALVFYMSGTLTVISGLKYFENQRRVPFSLYLIARYIRLTPVLWVTISFNILFAFLGTGPTYKDYYSQQIDNCDQRLWKQFLLIQNYDPVPQMCAISTWFMSADFQLYILAYFALYLLANKFSYGLIYSLIWTALGLIIPAVLTVYYNISPPFARVVNAGLLAETNMAYIYHCSTYSHLTDYFMGIITGYLLDVYFPHIY